MFVSDSSNQRVLEYLPPFTTAMNASVVFGQPDFISSGQNLTQRGMGNPESVALDGSGDLWSADFDFSRVLEFEPQFTNGMKASTVGGEPDFVTSSGNGGGSATQSNLSGGATGVAFDGACNLWVSDFNNNRVLQYIPTFVNGMNANLVIGQSDFVSSGSNTTANGLAGPQFITFDSSGNLWVADYENNRVLEFKPTFKTNESASLVIGQTDFISGGSNTSQNGLANPFGVAFDSSGNLWVADSGNNRVLKFPQPLSSGMNASVVIGQTDFVSGGPGSGAAGLSGPSSVAFDSAGNLYVVDPNNNRVLIFHPPLVTGMSASVAIGQPDLTSTDPATTAAGLQGPLGVTIGP
jgi:sugar lactone lactonase YvrE